MRVRVRVGESKREHQDKFKVTVCPRDRPGRGRLRGRPRERGRERHGAMLPLHAHVHVGNRLGHMRQPLIWSRCDVSGCMPASQASFVCVLGILCTRVPRVVSHRERES